MSDPSLVFAGEGRDGSRVVVNFGVFAGRAATEAEVYRLAQALLEELDSVEIVAEQRYEFAPDVEATVHQVSVEVPRLAEGREALLMSLVRDWAEDAIGERRVVP